MNCSNCGAEIEKDAGFCTNCGVSIILDKNIDGQTVAQNQEEPIKEFKSNIKKRKLINRKSLIISIISTIILIIALGSVVSAKFVKAQEVEDTVKLGNKYLQEGKYEEAILAFQKVIKIEPKNIEARVALAKAYVNIGKINEAENALKEAIDISPKKTELYLELAKLYISGDNQVNAIKILTDGYKATNDESIKSMLEELKSKITVDNVNKTIILGESYSLPSEVTVKMNNIEVQFPVKWDTTTVDVSTAGTQKFTGTLQNTDKVVNITLNVVTIASVDTINATVKQNDKYSLPSKVTAKMTDNSTRDVQVTWSPSNVDTNKIGTYSYEGSIEGYIGKAKLVLEVKPKETTFTITEVKISKEDVDVTYPQIQGLYDKSVENKINDLIKSNSFKNRIDGCRYNESYEITYNKNNMISILLHLSYYGKGAAHENINEASITVNLENGKVYQLGDFFNGNSNYKSIINQLIKNEASKHSGLDFESINDDQNFYLKDNSIVVYFNPYEIACFAAGFQRFEIDKSLSYAKYIEGGF